MHRGGAWDVNGMLNVGGLGNGYLRIDLEGSVTSGNTVIGDGASGLGEVTVDNADARLTTGGLTVGNEGVGKLDVLDGGEVAALETHIGYSVSGIGDTTLRLGWQAWRKGGRGLALRGTLKAPTGDPDKLTGSGGWDTSLYLEYTDSRLVPGRLAITAAAGLVVLGDGELAPAQQENMV